MPTIKQTAFRFNEQDLALLDALVVALDAKHGLTNRTGVLRYAIRRLAEIENLTLPKPKRTRLAKS